LRAQSSKVIGWVAVSTFGAAVAGWFLLVRDSLPRIDHTDPETTAVGQRIYGEACAICHGVNLEGQPNWREQSPNGRLPAPPHDSTGHTWHHSDAALFRITKQGPAAYPTGYPTDMPAFDERLTDGEIAAVIAYIKSTWPHDILRRQSQVNDGSR
jgi:mono/diheme cytochrome c family protein